LFLIGYTLNLFYKKLFLPACEIIGRWIGSSLRETKYGVLLLEIIFFMILSILPVTLILIPGIERQLLRFFSLLFLILTLLFIEVTAYHKAKQYNLVQLSLIDFIFNWLNSRQVWKTYIGDRVILLFNQLLTTYYLLIALTISLSLFIELTWGDKYYFGLFLLLPVYANIWVYFSFRLRFNGYDEIFMRRCIVYATIIIYGFYHSYHEFSKYLLKITFEFGLTDLLMYIAVFIYIAIDRLLKEIFSDYDRKKREFESTSS
jgi:hypothetical protein